MDRDQLNTEDVVGEVVQDERVIDKALIHGKQIVTQQASWDAVMHLNGVPRIYWEVKRDEIAFRKFEQRIFWRPDELKPKIYTFTRTGQQEALEGLMSIIDDEAGDYIWKGKDPEKRKDMTGKVMVASSEATPHSAKRFASFVVSYLQRANPDMAIRWVDATQRNRWGKFSEPREILDLGLLVVTGLHPQPTAEQYENVTRWLRMMENVGPTLLVGSGTDPVELSRRWYNVEFNYVFYVVNLKTVTSI